MPGTNTSDLSQTLVCLSWQLLGSPSTCDTLETVALGDGNAVNHLVLLKDCVNFYWLFEELVTEVDLLRDTTTIDLNLHQMSLLLFERGLPDLSVGEDSDDCAVLLDALELSGD